MCFDFTRNVTQHIHIVRIGLRCLESISPQRCVRFNNIPKTSKCFRTAVCMCVCDYICTSCIGEPNSLQVVARFPLLCCCGWCPTCRNLKQTASCRRVSHILCTRYRISTHHGMAQEKISTLLVHKYAHTHRHTLGKCLNDLWYGFTHVLALTCHLQSSSPINVLIMHSDIERANAAIYRIWSHRKIAWHTGFGCRHRLILSQRKEETSPQTALNRRQHRWQNPPQSRHCDLSYNILQQNDDVAVWTGDKRRRRQQISRKPNDMGRSLFRYFSVLLQLLYIYVYSWR